jgi:membrane-bound lytic murein transglycosylase D
MKSHLITIAALLVYVMNAGAQTVSTDTIKKPLLLKDNPVLAQLDSLAHLKVFRSSKFTTDTLKLNTRKYKKDSIPNFPESHYIKELKELDRNSPFDLVYNKQVRAYIDAYTGRHREKVGRMLGMAEMYFPLFEEMLDQYNLPMELKYLAVIESALNPNAQSKSGATGLWQFMYRTGKIYNLNVTSYVDERSDPYKATQAACEYFKFLYSIFGDWQMVLAAYNGGPGNLSKAMRRAGGKKDYWEVRPYLSAETQSYVPAFIAVNYVFTHAADHNIYPVQPMFRGLDIDTVVVKKQTNLKTLVSLLQMTYEEIEFLNPMYKTHILPENSVGMPLALPKKKLGVYLANHDAFYEVTVEAKNMAFSNQEEIMRDVRKTHTVRSGETLSSIAARYRCSVTDLKNWNKMSGSLIKVGQQLIVHERVATTTTSSATIKEAEGDARYHVVQAGETLWSIAKSNGISVDRLKELNNIEGNYQLKIGSKLKVG